MKIYPCYVYSVNVCTILHFKSITRSPILCRSLHYL